MADFLSAVQLLTRITFRDTEQFEYGSSYFSKIYRILFTANYTQVHIYSLIPSASANNRNFKKKCFQ